MPLIEYILSTIAPHECLSCGGEGALICSRCVAPLRRVPSRCYRCQQATEIFRTCPMCRGSTALYAVHPFVVYEGAPKELIHAVKFERLRSGAALIAQLLAAELGELPADVLVTHVPTATSRVRQRGYDQAELIARQLAVRSGLEYAPLLCRYGQQRQVGKNRAERHEQMQALFTTSKRRSLKGRQILLVDDVLTTGATLEACAAVLKEAGARRITATTFAAA